MRTIKLSIKKPDEEPVITAPRKVTVTRATKVATPVPVISPESDLKQKLLADIEIEHLQTRRDRDKVSNLARERWKAGADQDELRDLYERINNVTEQLMKIYDRREYVERYGKLPEVVKQDTETMSADVAVMKNRKVVLNYSMSKLRKNIKNGKPKNPDRKNMWVEQLAIQQSEWEDLDRKIKNYDYHARSTD